MNILQRYKDWQNERRITRLSRQVVRLMLTGKKTAARLADCMRMSAIRSRSPQQIARMERRMGLV